MQFTKGEFAKFREAMKKAVSEVEKEFGVGIEFGAISYDSTQFTIKTTVMNGSVEEAQRKRFEEYAVLYDLKPSDYGREFQYKGLKTTIIGLETNRKKYPILVKDENGKEFLMTVSGVKACLENC